MIAALLIALAPTPVQDFEIRPSTIEFDFRGYPDIVAANYEEIYPIRKRHSRGKGPDGRRGRLRLTCQGDRGIRVLGRN